MPAFNVLALIKGEERYVFVYDDASRQPLLEAFEASAADPDLAFTWYDAAILTEKAREQLRFAAATALRDGLVRTIQWTQTNRDMIAACMRRHGRFVPELRTAYL